jgi:hypothetical protein
VVLLCASPLGALCAAFLVVVPSVVRVTREEEVLAALR